MMTANRRLLLKSAFVLGSVAMLCGLEQQNAPRGWIPGHVESMDPSWRTLAAAPVRLDEQRGLFIASFSDAIRRLAQSEFTIGGFILPLEATDRFTHFALTRRNASCPFCLPNQPTEAIEIFAAAPLEFTPHEYVVSGRLEIVAESSEGLFYRVRNARVRKR